ncbi:MAG: hypothetical protein ACPG4T_05230, partial [Nannocystaceae bacterium]
PEPSYHAPVQPQVQAPEPSYHAPVQPQVQAPEPQYTAPAPSQQPAPQQPAPAAPVLSIPAVVAQPSVDTSKLSGQWLEIDAGSGDPHQQTFVMSLTSGYVLVRTRTQGQSGPIETTVAAPGTLADFRLR